MKRQLNLYMKYKLFYLKHRILHVDVCVCVREREREREKEKRRVGLLSLTPYLLNPRRDTHIQNLASSSFFDRRLTRGRFSLPAGVSTLLTVDSVWPTDWLFLEWKTSSLYIFCTPTHWGTGAIHTIHLRCSLLTLRHSCIYCLRNLHKPSAESLCVTIHGFACWLSFLPVEISWTNFLLHC